MLLAIFPPGEVAQSITGVAAGLREAHGLHGWYLLAERLHITLHAIDGFQQHVPQSVMDASIAACASVMCRPLPVVFDRVGSFSNHNRSDNNAFELRCDADTDAAIVRLQQSLKVALRRSGLRPKPSTTPHMTLLCDRLVVPEHPITPIRWTATQFALILSHVGIGHHQRIAQWELG